MCIADDFQQFSYQ